MFNDLLETPGYKTLVQTSVPLGDGDFEPDGVTRGNSRIILVQATAGKLKSIQQNEIAADVLRLASIKQHEGFAGARCEIYFVDQDALDSVAGWMKGSASELGVELKMSEAFPIELRDELLVCQQGQAEGTKKKKAKSKGKKKASKGKADRKKKRKKS
ncbi:MAG: hypothetical protein WBW44_02595 [Solirubrobacterales bacterium]